MNLVSRYVVALQAEIRLLLLSLTKHVRFFFKLPRAYNITSKTQTLITRVCEQMRNVSEEQHVVNTTAPGREAEHLHVLITVANKNSTVAAHT